MQTSTKRGRKERREKETWKDDKEKDNPGGERECWSDKECSGGREN